MRTAAARGPAWIVDSHVHLHPCFDVGRFLDAAWTNFERAAATAAVAAPLWRGTLLFTESYGDNAFQTLAGGGEKQYRLWRIERGHSQESLIARRRDSEAIIQIAAGRQIVTREGLEVAALGTTRRFEEGLAIESIIQELLAAGIVAVLPWGFGKWLGRRGNVVRRLIDSESGRRLLLGDNGGRPRLSSRPPFFNYAEAKGIAVIPGSDPLPFPSEYKRAGSYAFSLRADASYAAPSAEWPLQSLWKALHAMNGSPAVLGRRTGIFYFMKSQIAMQVRKAL